MRSLVDLVFPPSCPLCDKPCQDSKICSECEASLHYLEGDFAAPHLDRIFFDRARSCFAFEGRVLDAIHGLKYLKRFDLISVFAEHLVREARNMGRYDMIVPVPVHWWRLWRRGYNQSALLARAVGKELSVDVELRALKKKRLVHPQVGLSRDERLKNMKGVFTVDPKKARRLEKARILIIDDVLTTGATVNECAKTLVKKARCDSVDVLTVARTI